MGEGDRRGLGLRWIAAWLAAYLALIGIFFVVDKAWDGDSLFGLALGAGLVIAGVALGWMVPRVWVVVIPFLLAAVVGLVASIGYEGEDSLLTIVVIAEIYFGVTTAIGSIAGIVVRRRSLRGGTR